MNNQLLPRTESYGPLIDQTADLYLPSRPKPPVVCLLHGGFWRMPYGRDQMNAVARDLVERGYAVWNLEYRRLGSPACGWPDIGTDVTNGIEHLTHVAEQGIDLDLNRVALIGHSAGGQLALWCAAQRQGGRTLLGIPRFQIKAVVGEAPVADLKRAYEKGIGKSAVAELMGATPDDDPELYHSASPIELLPLGIPQLIIQDIADSVVPIEIARAYTTTALAAGDQVDLIELTGAGHMVFIDPASSAHHTVCDWLDRILE
ncbi:MAG: alpha/beta fold hydrolase [Ignavibacteriae bacterium]|nr:MAG: alpha/beta fold hydrolase [Ignavibacteriota bacterium]